MKPFYLILPLALAGLLLAIAPSDASARAFKAGMVDPVPNGYVCDGSAGHDNASCNIYTLGSPPYVVSFVSCTNFPNGIIPPGIPTSGYNYCLWMNNATGGNLATFNFTVPVPVEAAGQQLDCQTFANFTPTSNCSQILPLSGNFTLSFFVPPSALVNPGNDFYLLTDFDTSPGPASVSVGATVHVPEPGELGLFGLGLLGIGVGYGWKKQRQSREAKYAA